MKKYRYLLPLLLLAALALVSSRAGAALLLWQNQGGGGTALAALSTNALDHHGPRHRHTQQQGQQQPTAPNMDCSLVVPPDPLSARGLGTPYQLVATNPDNGASHESNKMQAAFVQGAILDPAAGMIAIYNPLVVDQGTQAAVEPQPPLNGQIPPGDVVALWFGSNGNTLTLVDSGGSLAQGHCVNGADGSIFGQFSYCNAPTFFQAANQAIQAGKLVPPQLGTANDGKTCPTTRDFSIVDQDQSDNVTATYLITASGQTAQNSQANLAALGGQVQANGSDERLLTLVDQALGCTPWMAPDLADQGRMVPALPLNELQAAAQQADPVALVPTRDPMVLLGGNPNLDKLNAYRAGVDQAIIESAALASSGTYCQNLLDIAPGRLLLDKPSTRGLPSPDPALANSLFTFLAQRFVTTYGALAPGLNCQARTGTPDPVTVQVDGNGVAVSATIRI